MFRPFSGASSGTYSAKKNTVMASYSEMRSSKQKIERLKWVKRIKSVVNSVIMIVVI
jgi:hypothetical protein